MEELLAKLPMWVKMIPTIVTAIVAIATVVVRVTPSKSDDETVAKISAAVNKFITYFPTIGKNPKTAELEKEVA